MTGIKFIHVGTNVNDIDTCIPSSNDIDTCIPSNMNYKTKEAVV